MGSQNDSEINKAVFGFIYFFPQLATEVFIVHTSFDLATLQPSGYVSFFHFIKIVWKKVSWCGKESDGV